MTDPAIIEAAARALQQDSVHKAMSEAMAKAVLAAVTPLIRAAALEEAATRLLELAREERNLDGATLSRAAEYLDALRALIPPTPPPFAASA